MTLKLQPILAKRIVLTWLVATGPLLASSVFYILAYANREIAFTRAELAGTALIRPLDALVEDIPRHESLVRDRYGRAGKPGSDLRADEARIAARFEALDRGARVYARLPATPVAARPSLRELPDFGGLEREWSALRAALGVEAGPAPAQAGGAADAQAEAHRALVAHVLRSMHQVGDVSNLILDTDLDSYYLVDLVLNTLPRAQERLLRVEDIGGSVLAAGWPVRTQQESLGLLAIQLRESDLDGVSVDVETALSGNRHFRRVSRSLQRDLPLAFRHYADAQTGLIGIVGEMGRDAPEAAQYGAFRASVDGARSANFALWRSACDELDGLLRERLRVSEDRRLWGFAFIGLSLLSSTVVTLLLGRSVAGRIRSEQLAQAQMRRLNEDLELRVGERTRQLTATVAELEAFSYSVSHDLRSPLRAIDGFSRALEEDYAAVLDETAKDYLMRIRRGSQRMGLLIDDMLKLARVSRVEMAVSEVSLTEIADETVAGLRRREPLRQVSVRCERGLTAVGDRTLIQVVLENLIENAWKYTRRQPEASIEFFRSERKGDAGEALFVVRDNGAGFDMRYAGKLFSAFQRLHSASEFEGTGIGLATVQRILARHGGHIQAQAAPGRGATFTFSIGRIDPPSSAPPLSNAPTKDNAANHAQTHHSPG